MSRCSPAGTSHFSSIFALTAPMVDLRPRGSLQLGNEGCEFATAASAATLRTACVQALGSHVDGGLVESILHADSAWRWVRRGARSYLLMSAPKLTQMNRTQTIFHRLGTRAARIPMAGDLR